MVDAGEVVSRAVRLIETGDWAAAEQVLVSAHHELGQLAAVDLLFHIAAQALDDAT